MTSKAHIPQALREQVWLKHAGQRFKHKCLVVWCKNMMTVFDFQAGHNIPESLGGLMTLDNLRPICSRCNLSMNNKYTIDRWNALGRDVERRQGKKWFNCC